MKKAAASSILVAVVLLAAIAEAQQPAKIPRIGALHLGTTKVAAPFLEAFEQGLKDLGYVISEATCLSSTGTRRERPRDIPS
jgi:hypothetical protein